MYRASSEEYTVRHSLWFFRACSAFREAGILYPPIPLHAELSRRRSVLTGRYPAALFFALQALLFSPVWWAQKQIPLWYFRPIQVSRSRPNIEDNPAHRGLKNSSPCTFFPYQSPRPHGGESRAGPSAADRRQA